MNTFISFVIKETKHILRDKRTMMILFGMPVVMMMLFGFAISTDVKDVRLAVVTSQTDNMTERICHRLDASEYFTVTHRVATPAEAKRLMGGHKADMAIVFAADFANRRHDRAAVQLIANAADPNMAVQQSNYASQIILAETGGRPVTVNTKMLYNPQMRSTYNFVPGIMGVLLMIICTMMTSVSIVREKERGTMDVLLVSPTRPITIIAAKTVPYFALSVVITVCILLISVFALDVPMAGGVGWISVLSLLYIMLSLSIGLLISVVADTQLTAMLASAVVMLLPSILLSGMIFPVESMPEILQYISCAMPARWFISAMRKLMIMGVGVSAIAKELAVLGGMTVLMLGVALKRFKTADK
ncbi:MAG: ABC transporter permease [Prevotella sp.]|nr:ABC transporter permease [Prevotella sp.]